MIDNFRLCKLENKQYCLQWTDAARECYKRGCVCEGCIIKDILETPCDMKRAVFELVRKFGAPKEHEANFTKAERKIIDAINNGCNTFEEIAEYTKSPLTSIKSIVHNMYKLADADGYIYKNKRNKLGDFINWVRGENEEV